MTAPGWTRTETGGPAERRTIILRLLTEHGPMACNEIAPLLPPFTTSLVWGCPDPHNHDRATQCVHARQDYEWRPGYSNVYADLRDLEREKRVVRDDGRPQKWQAWIPENEEAEAIFSILQAFRGE